MTWPKAYNATLHGDIGDYRMLGTQKTYRFSFPDPLFPFGYGESPRSGASRPGCAQGAPADLAFLPRRSGRALRAR
jgi:hypothetical protein